MGRVIAIEGNATTGVEQGGEPEETTTDMAQLSLDLEIETPSQFFDEPRLCSLVVFELNTNNQSLTGTLVTNRANVALGTISTAAATKARVEVPVAQVCEVAGVRLTGTALTSRVEVSAIELEVDDPNPD